MFDLRIQQQHTKIELLHSPIQIIQRNSQLLTLNFSLCADNLTLGMNLSTIIHVLIQHHHARSQRVFSLHSHLFHHTTYIQQVCKSNTTKRHRHLGQPGFCSIFQGEITCKLHQMILTYRRIIYLCTLFTGF